MRTVTISSVERDRGGRKRDRETERPRQTDRQTERQTDRETDRTDRRGGGGEDAWRVYEH